MVPATRVTSTVDILVSGPFARTMLTNFFFFGSLNGFILLPLCIHQLGGNEAAIGVVQGMYSAAGMWTTLTVLLVAGFLASFRLRIGYSPPRLQAAS